MMFEILGTVKNQLSPCKKCGGTDITIEQIGLRNLMYPVASATCKSCGWRQTSIGPDGVVELVKQWNQKGQHNV